MRDQVEDQLSEQLSALTDGELSKDELPLVLARLDESPERRSRLARYYLARDGLQRGVADEVDLGLADRVREAIRDEPAHQVRHRTVPGSRYIRPVAGLALAASVAMVGVLVWPGSSIDESGQEVASGDPATPTPGASQVAAVPEVRPDIVSNVPVQSPEPAAREASSMADAGQPMLSPVATGGTGSQPQQGFSAVAGGEWDTLDGSQDPLHRYMLNHAEHASTGHMGGVLNYVRITGNENVRD